MSVTIAKVAAWATGHDEGHECPRCVEARQQASDGAEWAVRAKAIAYGDTLLLTNEAGNLVFERIEVPL
jgi:hypothetical protein